MQILAIHDRKSVMLIDARGRAFHLEGLAIQMLPSLGVGAFFIVIQQRLFPQSDFFI